MLESLEISVFLQKQMIMIVLTFNLNSNCEKELNPYAIIEYVFRYMTRRPQNQPKIIVSVWLSSKVSNDISIISNEHLDLFEFCNLYHGSP